jgi:ribosomal protein S18 acetylase RimI-like enzyme
MLMRPESVILRPAVRADAAELARLVDLASEGLSSFLWAQMAEPGETAQEVGTRRAARDEGAFSWRNATIAGMDGAVAGALVAYRLGDEPEPVDDLPPLFQPLQALENAARGTHYINVLATYPAFRRRGVATRLLAAAAAEAAGSAGLSLIVADGNVSARRLYTGFGFRETARAPLVAAGWTTESTAWVLMRRDPD